MINSLSDINNDFYQHGVFLSFSGPMSQDLMVEMGEVLKTKMKLEGATITTILKVFSIMVELNQNIIHYSAERIPVEEDTAEPEKTGCGVIAIGRENSHYFLLSGNLIETGKAEILEEKLVALNALSREDLKKRYRERRKTDPERGSKGAGLGFIEVARKASRPLEFNFEPISAESSFFSLKTVI